MGEVALVTGGGGFVGPHLVGRLLSEGLRVRVLEDWSAGRRENLEEFSPDIELFEGDICDAPLVRRAVEGVGVVFHQAALASGPRSFEEPLEFERVNVGGTLTLLRASADAGVRRFVFASSSACYGDPPDALRREDMPPRPISPYGVSKLACEFHCRAFCERFGLETVSLRYFNAFGPRQPSRSPHAAVVPAFIRALLEGRPPAIHGDGEQSRDFIFVGDLVEANLLAAQAGGVGGEVFNVGSGEGHTVKELLGTLQEIVGVHIEPTPAPPRAGDIRHSRADISKAGRLLGYRPRVSFEEGLRRTVEYFRGRAETTPL